LTSIVADDGQPSIDELLAFSRNEKNPKSDLVQRPVVLELEKGLIASLTLGAPVSEKVRQERLRQSQEESIKFQWILM
jgi:hypothetical protein